MVKLIRLKWCANMFPKEWENSQLANIIIIGGAGPKAFCAGGDVAALAQQNWTPEGQANSKSYFALEYTLDHLIATYPKPYIAYMDGITMGGGVGLSAHAPIRIATERTIFAMPETTIGFFPDVGASFFLPRMDGYLGTYLGLTSERLEGVNAFYAGIATHYIDSSSLPTLTERLSELVFRDYDPVETRLQVIDATIEEFGTGLPHDVPMLIAGELRRAIDRCFKHDTVENIIKALQEEKGAMREWAEKTLKTLHERSPTSLKVALKAIRLGNDWRIGDAFRREYHIAEKFMEHPDFVEGVSAKLINKPPTPPKWKPSTLQEVSDKDIDRIFAVAGSKMLQLAADGNWPEYPFGKEIGLPKERDVQLMVMDMPATKQNLLRKMVSQRNGKVGVREKVEEVLQRMCTETEEGYLVWREQ